MAFKLNKETEKFYLIGIQSSLKENVLAFKLNKNLGWKLEKIKDINLYDDEKQINFSCYKNLSKKENLYLVSNKHFFNEDSEGTEQHLQIPLEQVSFLIPKLKSVDFFLKSSDPFEIVKKGIVNEIQKFIFVRSAYIISSFDYKDLKNLIF